MSETGTLQAVRHLGPVTAADALAWFTGHGPVPAGDREVIGYLLAPDRAEWFRCAAAVAHGPDTPRDLAGAFELFATSGLTQLRWFHQAAGRGWAVSLGEDAAALPAGEPAGGPGSPERRRLGETAERMLAGRVTGSRDGWVTLATARYPSCDVPVEARSCQQAWGRLAEYAVRDRHGNVTVTDTLLLSLVARDPAPGGNGDER